MMPIARRLTRKSVGEGGVDRLEAVSCLLLAPTTGLLELSVRLQSVTKCWAWTTCGRRLVFKEAFVICR